MIITCPTCGQGYDTTGYPNNYKFACSCGTIIDVSALQQQGQEVLASGGQNPYVHPAPPQPLPPEPLPMVDPDSTMRTSPPVITASMGSSWQSQNVESLPDLHDDGYGSREAEATAVSPSPYGPGAHASSPPESESASHPELHSYPPHEENSESQPHVPLSWSELPADRPTDGEIGLPVDVSPPEKTEPRAIWALFLALFVVLGPLVWLLAARARHQIRLAPNIFRGKRLALLGMLLGIFQTLGLGTVLYLAFTQPEIHPLVRRVGFALGIVQPRSVIDSFAKQPADPARLTLALAQKRLDQRRQLHQRNARPVSIAYLVSPPAANYAYAYWWDPKLGVSRKGLYFRSSRGHWHLAHVETAYQEETRVFEPGSATLSDQLARQLIQKFWQLRGRFTGTHIQQLYVVQKPGSNKASAYWELHKQTTGKPLQRWVIASRFRRSAQGHWYLVRYAVRVPVDELHQFAVTAPPRLTVETARTLLAQVYKSRKVAFQPRTMMVYQEPRAVTGWLLWQNGRRQPAQRSLFRYSTAQKWHIARTQAQPAVEVAYRSKGSASLSEELAEKLLVAYLRKVSQDLRVQHLYVYQRPGRRAAHVRWLARVARKQKMGTPPQKPRQSLYHYTKDGSWNLSIPHHPPAQLVQFHHKGGAQLTAHIAKKLLRQYWKDQSWVSDSRRFSGATIKDLYVYQNPGKPRAWAHWLISNNDTTTPLRSSFYRSSEGRWYLGTYDLGKGYGLQFQKIGPPKLAHKFALPLLREYLQHQYKDTMVVIRDFYVVQPADSHQAYVRWVWQSGNKARVVFSMLHRSNQNRWYLSVAELPHPPSP